MMTLATQLRSRLATLGPEQESAFTTQFFAAEKVVSYAKAWHGGRLTVGDAPVAAVCSPSRPNNCSASFSSPLTHGQLKAYTEAKANPS